jgi:hypothetical protein
MKKADLTGNTYLFSFILISWECLTSPPPLAQLYRWKGEDFVQNIWGLKQGAIGNTLSTY